MNIMEHRNYLAILRRYMPPVIAFALFGALTYCAATCLLSCVDVLNYTIPAIRPENAAGFSVAGYWRETGLLAHFMGMPSSAQKYFVLHGAACGVCAVLAVAAVVYGIRRVFQRQVIRLSVRRGTNRNK